jgi:sterol desaturase/sphingolipid hydroxylase (fatty acid hydroxylase superfamily)
MHRPGFFGWVHSGHHRFRRPTAFASFAFDPAEALLTAWLLPALTYLIPIHWAALLAILMLMTVMAVLNHSGWEVFPEAFLKGRLGRHLITATHHDLHHLRADRNFGLLFRFWDRLMKTDGLRAPQGVDGPGRAAPPAISATD